MKIQFLGAAHEVTGSCTLLEACGKRILVDCGMEQGKDLYENVPLPCAPGEIDALLLTHAHIDHSGRIPALTAGGFSGPIYATGATKKLCAVMLQDSAHIQEFEAEWRNRKAKRSGNPEYVPMYTVTDALNAMRQFVACGRNEEITVAPGITARFYDAGHLLGSASILVTMTENGETKSVLFSGDLGNHTRPLIRNADQPEGADFVVIESTYGDREHGPRPDYAAQLTKILQETFDRGGNVVIPAFAVGRTQELLYLLRQMKADNAIHGHPNFPVYIDSPLAIETTEIYSRDMTEYYDEETMALVNAGINPIKFPGLRVSVTSDQSKAINEDPSPKVIISASGMCEAGRIRHHLKHNLWRAENTILFVGYQAEGSLGRILMDGVQEVRLFGETIQVAARIATIAGISGHADRALMLNWLAGMTKKPIQVFTNHGEDTVCDEFARTITDTLRIPAKAPYNGAIYDLTELSWDHTGNHTRLSTTPEKTPTQRSQTIYNRLVTAGERLMSVIRRNKGGTNKDLAKFADQIIALCEKWDR
jgi:metallo-beta-lactamase family protein